MGFVINVLAFATIKLASSLTLKVGREGGWRGCCGVSGYPRAGAVSCGATARRFDPAEKVGRDGLLTTRPNRVTPTQPNPIASLQVLGTVKNALLIVAAMVLYQESVTVLQFWGYVISTGAFGFYTWVKMKQIAGGG